MADTRRKRRTRRKKIEVERLAAYEGETLDTRITRVSEEKRQQRQEDVKSGVIDVPTELVEQMMLNVPPDEIDKFAVNKKTLSTLSSQSFIRQYFRKWEFIEGNDGIYWIDIDHWDTSPFYFIYTLFKLGVHRRLIAAPAIVGWGGDTWDGAGYNLSGAARGIAHLYKQNNTTLAKLAVKYLVNSAYIEPQILERLGDTYATLRHWLLYMAVVTLSPQFHAEIILYLSESESELEWAKQHTLELLQNLDTTNVIDPEDTEQTDFFASYVNEPRNYYDFVDYLFTNALLVPYSTQRSTQQRVQDIAFGSEIEHTYYSTDSYLLDESPTTTTHLINSYHYLAMARLHVGNNTLTDEQHNLLIWHPEFNENDEMSDRLTDAYDAYQSRVDALNDEDLLPYDPGTEWYARHPQPQ